MQVTLYVTENCPRCRAFEAGLRGVTGVRLHVEKFPVAGETTAREALGDPGCGMAKRSRFSPVSLRGELALCDDEFPLVCVDGFFECWVESAKRPLFTGVRKLLKVCDGRSCRI